MLPNIVFAQGMVRFDIVEDADTNGTTTITATSSSTSGTGSTTTGANSDFLLMYGAANTFVGAARVRVTVHGTAV